MDSPSIQPLAYYTAIAVGCTLAEFAERFPDRSLLIDPARHDPDNPRFETLPAYGGLPQGLQLVAPIAKRAGVNAVGSLITVGRASNNDLELGAPSVSKLHGHFVHEPNGDLVFVDGHSSGGTYVDGTRLAGGARTVVLPGARMRFGGQEALLCDPALLYAKAIAPPE